MNAHRRDRLALPVVLLYWLLLIGGLVLYTTIRSDDPWKLAPIWIGAVCGTAIGQAIALSNFRSWVVLGFLFVVVCWGIPRAPDELASKALWMAFVPATLCGFWCLGDRGSLAAFWFPTMIWMLSILDRTDANSPPDPPGIALLGGLAVMFVVFLRLREARRVGLWSTVSAAPLATCKPITVLKERPGSHVARVAWILLVCSIAFSLTAWVAPHLWSSESVAGDPITMPGNQLVVGLPCCTATWEQDTEPSRVKEYFDLGRSHDHASSPPREGIDCRACEGMGVVAAHRPNDPYTYGGSIAPIAVGTANGYQSGYGYGYGYESTAAGTVPTPGYQPPTVGETAPLEGSEPVLATPTPPRPPPPVPVQAYKPPPTPFVAQAGPMDQLPMPSPPPPQIATATPRRAPRPSEATIASLPHPSTARPVRSTVAPSFLHWLMVIAAAALLLQLVQLVLRPVRRLITLRHLRRPFWEETVDQRVSNSWQLALVGLRDAGWRSTSDEAPREFARRVGVDGLEQCATILERARHGIGIDRDDLSAMSAAADTAYHSARSRVGGMSRAMSWVRWPLT